MSTDFSMKCIQVWMIYEISSLFSWIIRGQCLLVQTSSNWSKTAVLYSLPTAALRTITRNPDCFIILLQLASFDLIKKELGDNFKTCSSSTDVSGSSSAGSHLVFDLLGFSRNHSVVTDYTCWTRVWINSLICFLDLGQGCQIWGLRANTIFFGPCSGQNFIDSTFY